MATISASWVDRLRSVLGEHDGTAASSDRSGPSTLTRVVVGIGTIVIGVIGLLSAPSEEYSGWGAVVTAIVSSTSLPVGIWICVTHRFRGRVVVAFVAWADVSITLCMLLKEDRLTAIGGTALFAVLTTLAVIATPLAACLTHMLYSTVVLAVIAVNAVLWQAASLWVIAAHTLTMLLVFLTPFVLLVHLGELRSQARQSLLDPLTGLLNRRGLEDALLRLAHRVDGDTTLLETVVVDVDDFKSVNDRWGHHVGDTVLTDLARHLTVVTAGRWVVARLGGDEFACTRVTDGPGAADELAASLTRVSMVAGYTMSAGAADVPLPDRSPAAVTEAMTAALRAADKRLYDSKSRKARGADDHARGHRGRRGDDANATG
ncbi:GGDEF domain-containing protein [Rhodococcus kroppenstedtii]|uniref:GGDEF domain-containing protein n=1 Tax=Rhodococcoides kroppenstedtii TaxID=293050 RepID=UPI00295539F9|nr:GGDEF domain-containing protein [Rhodococcus kroppenstedtii]MDV7197153.1 GGDEF domain-containing protein [Rhodococcus kroppenstedtii]